MASQSGQADDNTGTLHPERHRAGDGAAASRRRTRVTLPRLRVPWRSYRVIAGLVIIAATGALTVGLSGQSSPPSSNEELIAEIRALRADINNALTANVRAQLFVGRLQLQEQRMNALGAQLAGVRASLGDAATERGRLADRFESFQKSLASGDVPPEQRKDIEGMLAEVKTGMARADGQIDRLRGQESELAGQLTSEQGRWIYFNDGLDQIEQSLQQLTRPPR